MSQDTVTASLVPTGDEKAYPLLRHMAQVLHLETVDRDGEGNDDFVMSLMETILSAESVEDIFAAQETGMVSGKDFANRPFLLKQADIAFAKSTQEASTFPFYAILKVTTLDTGEEVTINCGGNTFMAVLFALYQKEYFAQEADGMPMTILSKPSPKGAYLLLTAFKRPTSGKQK